MFPGHPRHDEGHALFVFQVLLAESFSQFLFFHFFQVGDEKRPHCEHQCHADHGCRSDGHAQVGQDGSQRHRVSTIAERTGYDELLRWHHGERRASSLVQLLRYGPERQGESADHEGAADEDRNCSRLDSIQAKSFVHRGADDEKQVRKYAKKEDTGKHHDDDPFGEAMLFLRPFLILRH
jgi:hypothetical protein